MEYQLADFSILRSVLIDKINIQQIRYDPSEYSRNILYHIFNILMLIGFFILGWYVGKTKPLLGYLGVSIAIIGVAFEYLRTPFGMSIKDREWIIWYPLLSRNILVKEINAIKLSDIIVKGSRHSEVHIIMSSSSKPIKLQYFGIDAIKLHKRLTQARDKTVKR